MTFITHNAQETIMLGAKIGCKLHEKDIIAMRGTLGAGKTTITKGIAKALGVTQEITSPTFNLILEYEGRLPLYHIDVYRLQGDEDFEDIGANDLLYGNGVCIIEWSEKVQQSLPKNTIILDMQIQDDGSRKVSLQNWNYGDL